MPHLIDFLIFKSLILVIYLDSLMLFNLNTFIGAQLIL